MCHPSNFHLTATIGLLLFLQLLQRVVAWNVPVSPPDSSNASNLLRTVMALDESWQPILDENIKVNRDTLESHLIKMLEKKRLGESEVNTYQVIRYLVNNPGATGSELNFGVRMLGTALSCQIAKTVVLHTYYTLLYANRPLIKTSKIVWCMSQIQMALPSYLSKLDAFEQPVDHLVTMSNRMNVEFEKYDQNELISKDIFITYLKEVQTLVKEHMSARCGSNTEEEEIVKTVKVSSFNSKLFKNLSIMKDHRLVEIIQNINNYNYVKIVHSMETTDLWMSSLKIKERKLMNQGLIHFKGEDDDEDE